MSLPRAPRALLRWWIIILVPTVLVVAFSSPGSEFRDGVLRVATMLLPLPLVKRWPFPSLLAIIVLAFVWGDARNWNPGILAVLCAQIAVGIIAANRRPLVSVSAALLVLVAEILGGGFTFLAPSHRVTFEPGAVTYLLLTGVTAWIIGYSVRQRRGYTAALQDKAVTDERLRIARELHDMISHSIGVIAIQAGVGGRVIDTQPDEARKSLATIEATSRETLAQLRRTLGSLRRSDARPAEFAPAPRLTDLARLAESTGAAGVTVSVEVRGVRGEIPEDIDLSAYRIVQEALTNVVKHAGTTSCRVVISYAEALTLEVVDEGRGGVVGDEGYGLTGMRERVAMLGGEFVAGPRPDRGFGVRAVLPLPA